MKHITEGHSSRATTSVKWNLLISFRWNHFVFFVLFVSVSSVAWITGRENLPRHSFNSFWISFERRTQSRTNPFQFRDTNWTIPLKTPSIDHWMARMADGNRERGKGRRANNQTKLHGISIINEAPANSKHSSSSSYSSSAVMLVEWDDDVCSLINAIKNVYPRNPPDWSTNSFLRRGGWGTAAPTAAEQDCKWIMTNILSHHFVRFTILDLLRSMTFCKIYESL